MSTCGRRQAEISQQTQSLLAITLPPLLMKPSLTNADECRLVNRVEWQAGRGRPSSSLLLLLNLSAALRKMSIAALTQFAVYCGWHAWGDEARLVDRLTYQKKKRKAVVVLLYRAVRLLEWLWRFLQSPLFFLACMPLSAFPLCIKL